MVLSFKSIPGLIVLCTIIIILQYFALVYIFTTFILLSSVHLTQLGVPFSISCKAGQGVINSLTFIYLESISFLLFKDSFAGYSILGWQLISFATLKIFHSLLICKVSAETSADNIIGAPFYMTSSFSLTPCKGFSCL